MSKRRTVATNNACGYILCILANSTKMGLVEAKLAIIPGGGRF